MNKLFLSFYLLLVSTVVCAQTNSYDVAFLNDKGEILPPNATLNLSEVEESLFVPGQKQIATKLFIQNTSGTKQTVKLSYTVSKMEEGQMQVCTLGNCSLVEAIGSYDVESKTMSSNSEKEEVLIEHLFTNNAKCTVTLQLTTKEEGAKGSSVEKIGPKITLNFDTETTGGVLPFSQEKASFDVFNLQGILLHSRLDTLQYLPKGIYIIKQRNGKGIISKQKYIVS
ncbi:MAG: T9SS C-terminal target domain-containing protein [Prevotella sp.]